MEATGKQELEYTERVDAEAAASYLEGVARAVRQGKVTVEHDGEKLDLELAEPLMLEVEAELNAAKGKASLEISLEWRMGSNK